MSERKGKRTYDASGRRRQAEATRERICAAAETLFLRDGYARTTIGAVSQEAHVAEATVYLAFATKAALLDATILRAARDHAGAPLERLLAASPHDLISRFAAAHTALLERAAVLIALGEGAALMDTALGPLRERAHTSLRAAYAAIAERLAEHGLLGPTTSARAATATLYAICSETTYLRFTRTEDGTSDRYVRWLTATLEAALAA